MPHRIGVETSSGKVKKGEPLIATFLLYSLIVLNGTPFGTVITFLRM